MIEIIIVICLSFVWVKNDKILQLNHGKGGWWLIGKSFVRPESKMSMAILKNLDF